MLTDFRTLSTADADAVLALTKAIGDARRAEYAAAARLAAIQDRTDFPLPDAYFRASR